MTVINKTYADTEGAVRAWLRSLPSIQALVAQRVFFGIPDNAIFPLITVRQVGGGADTGEAPISNELIQLDLWGEKQNKAQATQLKLAVMAAFECLHAGDPMGPDAIALGGALNTCIWLPDPVSNQARYAATASVQVKAA